MEPPNPLRITISNRTGHKAPVALIRRAVHAVNQNHPLGSGSVVILLTTDEEQRDLNQRFRGMDSTTDVLTFPCEASPAGMSKVHLGDISISMEQAQRQATFRDVPLNVEVVFLAIHGALHLAGLDDELEADQIAMRRAMNVVAAEIGLPTDHEWLSLPAPDEVYA